MKKHCLAECIHYITKIPYEELVYAIYGSKKAYSWIDNLTLLLEKYNYTITNSTRSKWLCIAVMSKRDWRHTHAIVLRKGSLELNPYCVNLEHRNVEYFLIIK